MESPKRAQEDAGSQQPSKKNARGMPGFLIPRDTNLPLYSRYGVTVKFVVLVPVPPAVVTATAPVTAPVGTSTSTVVSLITL